jgi:methionyl-tRNA formyltransferase
MKIIFFGASMLAVPVIKKLHDNLDLSLVVTSEKKSEFGITKYCRENEIPCKTVVKFDQGFIKELKSLASPVAVLASFGLLVPTEVLDIFPMGILNIHPSLLPAYRGATPVQSSLLNGDKETGVSIIRLDEKLDHGPILGQEKILIKETDTSESLHEKLFGLGADMILRLMPDYVKGKTKLRIQNESEATFTKRGLTREDGYIDSTNPPKKEKINRMIRAYYPWPGVWTRFRANKRELRVKLLPGNKIQAEGGKPMGYRDFLNGYPELKDALSRIYDEKS